MTESTDFTVSRDGLTFFNYSYVTGNDEACLYSLFSPITSHGSFHRYACFELFNYITGLLLLIPANKSIKEKNADLAKVEINETSQEF